MLFESKQIQNHHKRNYAGIKSESILVVFTLEWLVCVPVSVLGLVLALHKIQQCFDSVCNNLVLYHKLVALDNSSVINV